jgi:hypothetical protein
MFKPDGKRGHGNPLKVAMDDDFPPCPLQAAAAGDRGTAEVSQKHGKKGCMAPFNRGVDVP